MQFTGRYTSFSTVGLPQGLLIQTYGLTAAKARLALLLVEGHTLRDTAEMNGVALNTVRPQVKSIFSKTGLVDRVNWFGF